MQQHHTTPLAVPKLPLVFLVTSWLAGVLLAATVSIPTFALLLGAGASLLFLFPLRHDTVGRMIMLLLICFFLGAYRYNLSAPTNDKHALSAFIDSKQSVTVTGIVADEPKIQGRSRTLLITVQQMRLANSSQWQEVRGQLAVQTLGTSIEDPYGANYGDVVKLQGKLQSPQPIAPKSVFADMAFPHVMVYQNEGNPIIAFFYHLRVTLAILITQSLPQPEAALLIAILLSLRTPALKPLLPAFNATGCAHLIAPSGFKVTIMAGLVISITRRLHEKHEITQRLLPAQRRGDWRQKLATILVVASIVIYTLLSGVGPAAIRAGIMGVLLVTAPRIGRVYNIYTALALSAFLMSIVDPFVLWDTGFLLSFIGTLGIVLLTPFFQRCLHPLTHLLFGTHLVEIFAVTLAAQTATLPLFAVTFHEVSFIAPLTNILTVPLLAILLILGVLQCIAALLFLPFAFLIGWILWPVLLYMQTVVSWCFNLPYSYMTIGPLDSSLAWVYYALLALVIYILQRKRAMTLPTNIQASAHANETPFHWSQRTKILIQVSLALCIVMATGTTALAVRPDGRLSVAFLDVAPLGQQPQGEAILVRTPDNKTILIDGGLDATALSQALASRLPSWQRTLDMVVLTSPRPEHLAGLQDIVTRYQITTVLDAGMLHPSLAYALWRRTISQRGLHMLTMTQGMVLAVGSQVTLQILWPLSPMHKGSDEGRDNGLVLRLVTPTMQLLLLGAAAQSRYALAHLLTTLPINYIRASIVQVIGEVDKPFSSELLEVVRQAHPSLLLIMAGALSPKLRKSGANSILVLPPSLRSTTSAVPQIQVLQTAQVGTTEISGDTHGWSINTSPL